MPDIPVAFTISALSPDDLRRIRAAGVDDFGNPFDPQVAEAGGSPLRCCLRECKPGESIALISYCPFPWSGPYAEVGPVFVHADECGGYAATSLYPEGFASRRQLLRAYDHGHRISDAIQAINGEQAEQILSWLLGRPEIDFVHSRNVEWGCYMFSARRLLRTNR
ncbi:MAG: DUF1203 domain-containing protein [Acidimicrobiales bacterium]